MRKKSFPILIIFIISLITMTYATSTMSCFWHASYFDAEFIANYGSGQDTLYRNDAIARANVVMQLDSIFRDLRKEGELPLFRRWLLLDHYHVSYDYVDGKKLPCKIRIQHDTVYLCMIDSVSINQAMKKLWNISDMTISPNKRSGMWLYSLHIKATKGKWHARNYPDTLDNLPDDRKLLWLFCENAYSYTHCFYQHEIDGFFHQYTGLYLTTSNVLQAQEIVREHYGIETTVTSQYVTPAILRKYVWY